VPICYAYGQVVQRQPAIKKALYPSASKDSGFLDVDKNTSRLLKPISRGIPARKPFLEADFDVAASTKKWCSWLKIICSSENV
jgi:hypothetical protein